MWSLGQQRLANGKGHGLLFLEESRIHCTGMEGQFRAHELSAQAVLEVSQESPYFTRFSGMRPLRESENPGKGCAGG